ncbi:Por secretion system C-terminal sorting domain-containing protein [Tangfeifania diversioriginum]|uniref:Por secretion system C-terminal sorting domain-containing protein n=1 Tax=Tangfeifania diversioriginum TaxID=1168035 RepID=A0A1M6GZD3_9BACT|nr:right-handed parallel beta-helix repeat-containing protein [Tangfeifania diversioriginum]SHJ15308.1 Por secretion system C-terminal sorting domain-containing protein [Tangfeifania diversioriginum]
MKKLLLSFSVVLIFLFTGMQTTWAQATINVPTDQPTIQDAITAASANDIINVAAGTYNESFILDKTGLTLQGPNEALNGNDAGRAAEAIIEGVARVEADDVIIKGLVIDGANVAQTTNLTMRGILVANTNARDNVTIENNIIKNWVTGISLAGSSTFAWVDGATITGNLFVNNGVGSTENVDGLSITNNAFDNGGIGLGGGAVLAVPITGNDFSNGSRYISAATGVTADFDAMLSANTFDGGAYAELITGQWYDRAIFSTIQGAIDKAGAGSVAKVADGTYNENVTISDNISLISENGASSTIIDGDNSGSELGTILLKPGGNGISIGAVGQGFTIKGIDGPAGLEKAAIYFQGAQDNITIEGNIIEARGDAALLGEYNAANNNITITNNEITGQTFTGANPAGVGFGAQFSLPNVPRQLVTFGGGSGTTNTQNFTFTNNIISGIAGGMSITDDNGNTISPTEQGNTMVTLDLVGTNVITGNTFSGTTTRYAYALRVRGAGAYTITENNFTGSYPGFIFSDSNPITATCNWFGTTDESVISSKMDASITFIPYNISQGGACVGGLNYAVNIESPLASSNCGTLDVPVTVQDFNNVGAISLRLNYDDVLLSYNDVTLNTAIKSATQVGETGTQEGENKGQIRLAYFGDAVTLNDDDVLFTLHFDILSSTAGNSTTDLTWDKSSPGYCELAGPGGTPVYTSTFNDVTGVVIPERPVKNVDTGREYCKIQDAIDADETDNGDVIEVSAGEYVESVDVYKSVILKGADKNSTFIQAPSTLPAASDALSNIVYVHGSGISTEISGFTIEGPGPSGCGSIGRGIFVSDGAYANIHDNNILDIRDNPFSGCQNGIAIQIGRNALSSSGTAIIHNNIISGYQKGAIVVDNSGSNATITNNTITGTGTTDVTAQNGIQVSRGATATLGGNTISGNSFHEEGSQWDWGACGILLYQSGAVSLTGGNNISGNDQNYYAYDVAGNLILGAETFGASTAPVTFGYNIADYTNQNIDASQCTFAEGNPASAVLSELFDIEDRIWHSVDDQTISGFVNIKAGNVYVTHTESGAKIQYGIDAASVNDVIHVKEGTYSENITVDKDVTLLGANAGVACDTRGAESTIAGTGGAAVSVASDGVTIDGFEITNPTGNYAVNSTGNNNLLLQYNNVNDVGTSGTPGNVHAVAISMGSANTDDVKIQHNCISNINNAGNTHSGSGIAVGFSTATTDITNLYIGYNTISQVNSNNALDYASGGRGANGIILNVGANSTGKVTDGVVEYNTIHDLSGYWVHGVGLEGNTPGALVQNNLIYNLVSTYTDIPGVGVKVEDNTGAATVSVNNNSFTSLSPGILNAVSGATVNATCNWFAADVTEKSLGDVTVVPWLVDGTNSVASGPGFEPATACVACAISIDAVVTNVSCPGGADDGAIDVTVTNGVSPYTYSWTGPDGFTSPDEDISGLAAGTYNLLVTADNGCSKEKVVVVGTDADVTAPTITEALDVLTEEGCTDADVPVAKTTVAELEAMGVIIDDCTLDENMTVSYSDASAGTCPVVVTRTYTVTDASNNSVTVDQTINIEDNTPPSIACPPPIAVKMNDGCEYDPAIGSGIGVATATDNCSDAVDIQISNDITGNLTEGENFITWTAVDECNNSVTCTQKVTVIRNTLSGTVMYNNTAQTPMANVVLKLFDSNDDQVGDDVVTSETNPGNFEFTGLCAGDYTVVASDTSKVGYINATDAGAANAWGTAGGDIEYVQFLAGDVNDNLLINSTDAQAIQNYFVFGGSFTKPWEYWSAGSVIHSNYNPFSSNAIPPHPAAIEVVISGGDVTHDLYAQATGDFNGSFGPTLKSAGSSVRLSADRNMNVEENQVFNLPLRSEFAMEVGAVSMILDMPEDVVQVTGVQIAGSEVPVTWAMKDNELRIGWNSLNPVYVGENDAFVVLKLQTSANFTEGQLMDIGLVYNPLNELADGNFEPIENAALKVARVGNGLTDINEDLDIDKMTFSNYPNPFSESTTLMYTIPVDGKVNISVYNALGQLVTTIVDENQRTGRYTINNCGDELQPGMYISKLMLTNGTESMVSTIKLNVVK